MHSLQPFADAGNNAQVLNNIAGAFAKKIHADAEQQHIHKAGNDDPFPQAVLADKLVSLKIGLYGDYNFF